MTLNGAIKQLHELRSAEDMPIYYKPAIAEVINVLLMDTQEVKHGKWVFTTTTGRYRCSACEKADKIIPWGRPPFDYCPNCGAKMEVE